MELTGYEYQALTYLALHSGEVVSKTQLTEHLYDQDFDRDSNVIEVFIGRLRRKLDPDGTLKLITTQRGLGYLFTMPDGPKSHEGPERSGEPQPGKEEPHRQ